MPIKKWSGVMQAFSIIFKERGPNLDGDSFIQFV